VDSTAPLIGTRWGTAISFMSPAALPEGKDPPTQRPTHNQLTAMLLCLEKAPKFKGKSYSICIIALCISYNENYCLTGYRSYNTKLCIEKKTCLEVGVHGISHWLTPTHKQNNSH